MMKVFIVSVVAVMAACAAPDWRAPKMQTPESNQLTPERIELGKLLFFDKRLSQSDAISCGSCHIPYNAWTDGLSKAVGHENAKGRRNTPTIVNSGYQLSYFWDGRAQSLEEQAFGPIEAHAEMAMPADELVKKLGAIKGYLPLFEAAYPGEGVTKESIAKALASFERTIVSKNSVYDRWMSGEKDAAMSLKAMEGLSLFEGKGKCSKCHGGYNFSYGSYENVGLDSEDLGMYELNQNRIWYGSFKTPTLREVADTAPYFHDGSVHTLEETVHICGNGGRYSDASRSPFFRDRGIGKEEMRAIVAFLETLSSQQEEFELPKKFPE